MGPNLFEAPPTLSAQELCLILKEDLTSFIERSFYELHPGHRLNLTPHIEVIATRLEAVRRGEIRCLIINLPPRHLKSHCVSVAFIAWLLGHHPAKDVISPVMVRILPTISRPPARGSCGVLSTAPSLATCSGVDRP